MKTNREFYLFIAELVREHRGGELSLEGYLGNLRALAGVYAERSALTLAEFAKLTELFVSVRRNAPD